MPAWLKAIGIVVTDDGPKKSKTATRSNPVSVPATTVQSSSLPSALTREDCEKFEKHFDQLLDSANLPGPDYYEYAKVEESLEPHMPDEKSRMFAAYTSLNVQSPNLTKQLLLDSAVHYVEIVGQDKNKFQAVLKQKEEQEVSQRTDKINVLQKKIDANRTQIEQLTKEINDCSASVQTLKSEVDEVANRLAKSEGAYIVACDAMINKINSDIEKIKINL